MMRRANMSLFPPAAKSGFPYTRPVVRERFAQGAWTTTFPSIPA